MYTNVLDPAVSKFVKLFLVCNYYIIVLYILDFGNKKLLRRPTRFSIYFTRLDAGSLYLVARSAISTYSQILAQSRFGKTCRNF